MVAQNSASSHPRHHYRRPLWSLVSVIFFTMWGIPLTAQDRPAVTVAPQRLDDEGSPAQGPNENWIQLFNGQDLSGWTPKIRYHAYGENYGDTFRVEDGLLKVRYDADKYPTFGEKFGHLFHESPYSNYKLRVEYRFVGEQVPGGPGWAIRNSGLMLHCEDPKEMRLDQDFPTSIEYQLLGGNGRDERTTANLCTPGTNVVLNGKLFTPHCTNSTSKTYHGEQWVTAEVEVHGAGEIIHWMEGKEVLRYSQPQLDPADPRGAELIAARGGQLLLSEGYISLQSESHPIDFRKVEILELPNR
jgi:hypothetical protein